MRYTPSVPYESATQRHYTIQPASALLFGRIAFLGSSSNAWPAASVCIYVPVYINEACTIYEVGIGCGATAGGNFEIGLYDIAGNKKQSTGSVARTNSAWNVSNWTDLDVTPGWYYAAMTADGTNNYSGLVPAAGLNEAFGVCEQTSVTVGSMPSTATLSRTTRTLVPNITFAARSVAL